MTVPSVGLVGAGMMGRPAAELLAAAGHPTFAYDRDPEVRDALAAKGVVAADSLRDLAGRSDVMVVMVPSDEDVIEVCGGPEGLLASAHGGAVLLICSSVLPDTCRRVADLALPHGIDVLDAALTGGVRAAQAGAVNLLVGGDATVLDRIRPALEPWTATVHHLGPLGSGQIGKTVNNLCHWGQLSVIVESLRLGRALGMEPSRLRPALLDSPVASRTLREMELMKLTWPVKDLENAFRMAARVDQQLPLAHAVREAMRHITVSDIAELYIERRPGPSAEGPTP